MHRLEQLIKETLLLGKPSAQGWYPVTCKLCNDYKPRGGFLFSPTSCSYKCFNCGWKTVANTSHDSFSRKMLHTLTMFGIPENEVNQISFAIFFARTGVQTETLEERHERNKLAHPVPIELPSEFEFINAANPSHTDAINYITPRFVDYAKYGLMVSTTTNPINKWYKRIIVPMYNRANQVIFFQGRTYDNHSKRWDSPADQKANVLFGYHNLDDYSKDYIIICEGPFDMMSIDGVAILGSEFSPFHVRVLNASSKKKIVVPQRDKRGYALALQALEHGYSLSFPDIGGAQDINDAIIKYGRLYTEQQIVTKTASSKYEAQLKLGMWCST